jgi:hypothetical protein
MVLVHEFGHMLAARITGGRVISVSLPFFGFSQTIVHPNPHELFVVWGGPLIGAALPLTSLGIWRMACRSVPEFLRFFAGFCCIANGAYIGFGWIRRAGDAGDMLRLGTPIPVMIAFGAACTVLGLLCWHYTSWLRISYWQRNSQTILT